MALCKSLHEEEITYYHCLLYYEYFQSANPLGQVFFVTFVFVVFFGLMSMFVTIICEAFAVIKEDAQEATNDYEVCMVYYGHGIYYSIAAMGKVRPFCPSGLEANILRPSCGLLSEKFCHHHCLEYSCHLLKSSPCIHSDYMK